MLTYINKCIVKYNVKILSRKVCNMNKFKNLRVDHAEACLTLTQHPPIWSSGKESWKESHLQFCNRPKHGCTIQM